MTIEAQYRRIRRRSRAKSLFFRFDYFAALGLMVCSGATILKRPLL